MEELDLRASGAPLLELEFTIASLRARNGHLLKVLHREDRSRNEIRALLRKMHRAGKITAVLTGEAFGKLDEPVTAYLADKYPGVAEDPDYGAGNGAVTLLAV